MSLIPLPKVIERLKAYYGKPDPPEANNPWEMILWENIAYLADDERPASGDDGTAGADWDQTGSKFWPLPRLE